MLTLKVKRNRTNQKYHPMSIAQKESKLWYLENVSLHDLFCEADPKDMMKDDHAMRTVKKGEFIYFPNDVSNKIYFIEMGRVKIGAYSDDGREIIKAVLQSGELFGELGLIGEEKRVDFAQAMESTKLCIMPVNSMKMLMEKSQFFALQITQLLGNKLLRTERRLESLVFKDARSRIIEFLYDLTKENGRRIGYEWLVNKFFTHQEIANLTGTSRQTVTTILNELREENYIYFDRKKLLVRDLKKLGALIQ